MEKPIIVNEFRVEVSALKITRRYRIIHGEHHSNELYKTYWLETYDCVSRKWVRVSDSVRFATCTELLGSKLFWEIFFKRV